MLLGLDSRFGRVDDDGTFIYIRTSRLRMRETSMIGSGAAPRSYGASREADGQKGKKGK